MEVRKMKAFLGLAVAAAFLTGCASAPRPVALGAAFDAQRAQELLGPGGNVVSGSALIRQNGGGVVTCAGLNVMLIPRTQYASERVQVLYGNTTRGYNPVSNQVKFTPDPPEYLQLSRKAVCDAQGNFTFSDVADGEFFVVSLITWKAGRHPQGGGLMQSVSVAGGVSERVVLSP